MKYLKTFESFSINEEEETTEQNTSASSSRTQPTKEFYSPERERVTNLEAEDKTEGIAEEDEENGLPVFEDYHLKDLMEMRIKEI
jgi:hypothetical protein